MPASETPTIQIDPETTSVPPPPKPQAREFGTERELRAEIKARRAAEDLATEESEGQKPTLGARSSSRYLDYDSHELLEKISQYEDERRWQRIREGIWISIILHFLLFSGLTWIPRYVFHQPQVIDPFDAIKKRKDLTYLDELPDAIKEVQKAKPKLPPLKPNDTVIDRKTMDSLKAEQQVHPKVMPQPPAPEKAENSPPPPAVQLPQTQTPVPQSVATPAENPQVALESPRPAPVPVRPNFSLPSQSPADQLRQAMRDSSRGEGGTSMSGGSVGQHSGADGGAQILSDTQGVDFGPYLQKVIRETYRTWDPLIPEEVNPPISKRGQCEIVFTILPNGRLQPHQMMLTGRSGDVALDRAAWGAIEGADYPPLPREFHGPYLQLRFQFQYNLR